MSAGALTVETENPSEKKKSELQKRFEAFHRSVGCERFGPEFYVQQEAMYNNKNLTVRERVHAFIRRQSWGNSSKFVVNDLTKKPYLIQEIADQLVSDGKNGHVHRTDVGTALDELQAQNFIYSGRYPIYLKVRPDDSDEPTEASASVNQRDTSERFINDLGAKRGNDSSSSSSSVPPSYRDRAAAWDKLHPEHVARMAELRKELKQLELERQEGIRNMTENEETVPREETTEPAPNEWNRFLASRGDSSSQHEEPSPRLNIEYCSTVFTSEQHPASEPSFSEDLSAFSITHTGLQAEPQAPIVERVCEEETSQNEPETPTPLQERRRLEKQRIEDEFNRACREYPGEVDRPNVFLNARSLWFQYIRTDHDLDTFFVFLDAYKRSGKAQRVPHNFDNYLSSGQWRTPLKAPPAVNAKPERPETEFERLCRLDREEDEREKQAAREREDKE